MQFYVGLTDTDWFNFLRERNPDDINFWKPSGKGFSAIEPGAPFLFKLKSPIIRLTCEASMARFLPSVATARIVT